MSALGIWVTLLAAVATVVANILLKRGLQAVPATAQGTGKILALCASFEFLLGLVFYVLAMLPWLWVVSREPLGSAYPLLVGAVFLMLLLTSAFVQGEPLTGPKVAGAALIVLGIICVGKG